MLISCPICRNCGNHWLPDEDVSALRNHCPKCSMERQAEADRLHRTSERYLVHKGSYVFLSPNPNKVEVGRKNIEWKFAAFK